jgi:excisionase family DNA binding protein
MANMTNEQTILLQGISVADFLAKIREATPGERPSRPHDENFNVKQAAEFLKISVPSVWRLKLQNKIPYKQVGSRVVFVKAELAQWLKDQ